MKDVESLLVSNITKIAQEAPKPIAPVPPAEGGVNTDKSESGNVAGEPNNVDRFDRLSQSIDSLTGILNRVSAGVPSSLQSAPSILQMMKGDVIALKDFYG